MQNKKLLSEICEPVDYIPEMIKADQLLTKFDKDHKGVKVVVDEFGGFVGIIGAEAVLSVLAGWWKNKSWNILKLKNVKADIIEASIREKKPIKEITTKGDQVQDIRLSEVGGKGLFSTNIEKELQDKKIDIAVHALKDMPSEETLGLITNCFLKRNSPEEILITRDNKNFTELNSNSIIGTSSFRRELRRYSILLL